MPDATICAPASPGIIFPRESIPATAKPDMGCEPDIGIVNGPAEFGDNIENRTRTVPPCGVLPARGKGRMKVATVIVELKPSACPTNGSQSGRGQPHSKTLSRRNARRSFREVLECGCPLPLSWRFPNLQLATFNFQLPDLATLNFHPIFPPWRKQLRRLNPI